MGILLYCNWLLKNLTVKKFKTIWSFVRKGELSFASKNDSKWLKTENQNCNASQVSYFLQKVSDTTNSKRLHSPWAFWILGTFFKWTGNINIIFIKFEYLTYHFLTKNRDRIDSIDTLFQYRMLVLSALCIQLELDEPFF